MPDYLCKSCGAMLEDRDIRVDFTPERSDELESIYRYCIPCGSGEVVEITPKDIAETCARIALEIPDDQNQWSDQHFRMQANWKQLAAYFLEVW